MYVSRKLVQNSRLANITRTNSKTLNNPLFAPAVTEGLKSPAVQLSARDNIREW